MKYPLSTSLFIVFLIVLTVGCTTTTRFGSHVVHFDRQHQWVLKPKPGPGAIDFTVTLRQRERVRVLLARPNEWPQIAYLELLDEDCEFGHKGHLVYLTEKNGFQSLYFDQEIPWGEPIEVTLEWSPDRQILEARINGQLEQVNLIHAPSKLRFSGTTYTTKSPELIYRSPVELSAETDSMP